MHNLCCSIENSKKKVNNMNNILQNVYIRSLAFATDNKKKFHPDAFLFYL